MILGQLAPIEHLLKVIVVYLLDKALEANLRLPLVQKPGSVTRILSIDLLHLHLSISVLVSLFSLMLLPQLLLQKLFVLYLALQAQSSSSATVLGPR